MRTNATFVARVVALIDDVPEHGHAQVLAAVRRAVHALTARARPGQRAAGETRYETPSEKVEPWTSGDVWWIAKGRDFPGVELRDGRVIAGEPAWRTALDEADADQLVELREVLREAADDIDDDLDDRIDADEPGP